MQHFASLTPTHRRSRLRLFLAFTSAALGLALLFIVDNIVLCLPFLFLSDLLASPPTPRTAAKPAHDLLDSSAEVNPRDVFVGLAVLALAVLLLSFSGPFWSWLTDRVPYSPPSPPVPAPLWGRLLCASIWSASIGFRAYSAYRKSRPGRTHEA